MSPPGEAKIRGRVWCRLAAVLCGLALCGAEVDRTKCNARFQAPEPGSNALSLNGVQLADTCINTDGPHEVFIIGDWGGIYSGDPAQGPVPADHRESGVHKRDFVEGLDDHAQHAVRDRMVERASEARPEYVLNVGDNFYWGGVEMQCGATRRDWNNFSWQWDVVYENFYAGEGLDGVQWLGVLGNHDYGGFMYTNGWDQAILYTWKQPSTGKQIRWMTPALYWSSTVHYLDFSVDYFFVDTNVYDAFYPFERMGKNICSYAHNSDDNGKGDCSSEGGPADVYDCYKWFLKLWAEQKDWLHLRLSQSEADWQVVVTHFPPSFDVEFWSNMTIDYGIDLFVTGHLHRQEVWGDNEENFLAPTVVAVSGGGGGITSDYPPNVDGDDQYGYMRMNLFKDRIEVLNIMHTGAEGDRATALQRSCYNCTNAHIQTNWESYANGFEERGRLGDPIASTTSSTPCTSTGTTTAMTTSVPPVATESLAKPAKTAEETALAPAAATNSVPMARASDPPPASSDSSASSSAEVTAATTPLSQAAATASPFTTPAKPGIEEVAVAPPPGGGAGAAPATTSAEAAATASPSTAPAQPGIEEVAVAPPPGGGAGAAPATTSAEAAATASPSTAPAQPGIEEVAVAPPPGGGAGAAPATTSAEAAATASPSTTLVQPGIEEVAVAPAPGDGAGAAPVTTSVEVAATTSSATTWAQPGIKEEGTAQQHNHTVVYAASQNSGGADASPLSPGAPPEKSPWFGDGASQAGRLASAACVGVLIVMCALAGIFRGARRSADGPAASVQGDDDPRSRTPPWPARGLIKTEGEAQQALIDDRDFF